MRTYIKDLKPGQIANIEGYVYKIRDQKTVQFLIIRDITGSLQISVDKEQMAKIFEISNTLTPHSFVKISGKVEDCPKAINGIELYPTSIIIDSIAEPLPIAEDSNLEQKLDYRWIDLRDPKNLLIFKTQTSLVEGMRQFLLKENFLEIHTPKITLGATESGASVFPVKYFDETAYLVQSPQFYKQMAMCAGLERYFEVAPCFRAERSFSPKHATEFTGFDVEMTGVESHEDLMKLEERMIVAGFEKVKQQYGEEIKKIYGMEIEIPKLPFPRISMEEIYEILQDKDIDILEGEDLDSESERVISEYMKKKTGSDFFFITDFPTELRCFYTMKNPKDKKKCLAFDLYYKGMEITSGARREHRYEELKQAIIEKNLKAEDLQYYLDFFKYGAPSHGGLGIGLERLTMLLLNISSIKETMFVFRGPNRVKP
jgi:aspartyl-tRNA synthetase